MTVKRKCTHDRRTDEGERMLRVLCGPDPLADAGVLAFIAEFRRQHPEELADEERIIVALTKVLMKAPRVCEECGEVQ